VPSPPHDPDAPGHILRLRTGCIVPRIALVKSGKAEVDPTVEPHRCAGSRCGSWGTRYLYFHPLMLASPVIFFRRVLILCWNEMPLSP
jgi:hypothetical protein